MGSTHDLSGKTILVSGAVGMIPSFLCEFYLNKGATVIGIDNFLTGLNKTKDTLCETYENFKFFEADVARSLPTELDQYNIDYIFHMASPASPIDFKTLQLEIMEVNIRGTQNLLELARSKNARFLMASTSEAYGDPEIHPQNEEYRGNVSTTGPRACYDESKRMSETYCSVYNEKFGVETRIIRIFNTYGPRMRSFDGRVIPNFINQALKGEDLTVYGDGSQTRSYCFVTDLVDAIDHVMFSNVSSPVNVGSPDEYTILETAQTIIEVLNSSSKISFQELPKDDPKKRKPDISKLKSFSDYCPSVPFHEGIRRTAEFFKDQL